MNSLGTFYKQALLTFFSDVSDLLALSRLVFGIFYILLTNLASGLLLL